MKQVNLLLSVLAVSIGATLTYYVFEYIVHVSIDFVWEDVFQTDQQRLVIIPLCLVISLVYFGVKHQLSPTNNQDKKAAQSHLPDPTVTNFLKILLIGFLSLLAGASLGPEAILVPACILIGAYAGVKLFHDSTSAQLLAAAGLIALFAAFFHSFIVGVLSLALVVHELKIKINLQVVIIAIIASAVSSITLTLIDGQGLVQFPPMDWGLSLFGGATLFLVFIVGGGLTYLISITYAAIRKVYAKFLDDKAWWIVACVAAIGLGIIYLIGGPFIEFTGNKEIPLLIHDSATFGMLTLFGILIMKILAIAWSKAAGYRGGLIFPSIFLMTAVVLLFDHVVGVNFIYGLIVGLAGMVVADRKVKILF